MVLELYKCRAFLQPSRSQLRRVENYVDRCLGGVALVLMWGQDKVFEVLDGDLLQPYMDAIELEGSAAQPMDEGGVEEEKASDQSYKQKLAYDEGVIPRTQAYARSL